MRSTLGTIAVVLALVSATPAFADGEHDIGEKQTYGVGDAVYGSGSYGESIVILSCYPKRKEFTISHRALLQGRPYAETVTLAEGDAISITRAAGRGKGIKVLVRFISYGPWCTGDFLVRLSM